MNIKNIIPGKVKLICNALSDSVIQDLYNYVYWNNDFEFDEQYTCSGKKILDKSVFNPIWNSINHLLPEEFASISLDKIETNNLEIRFCSSKKIYFKPSSDRGTRILIYLNSLSSGGIRIYKNESNYLDLTPTSGNLLLIHSSIKTLELEVLGNTSKYFIQLMFKDKVHIEDKLSIIKVSEIGTRNNFSHVPNTNRFKYKPAQIMFNNDVKFLVSGSEDSFSNYRWKEVIIRPRIFNIEKCNIDINIDAVRGRPPTNYEDYCPNCYEILPILNEYKNCSGCCSPVTSINYKLRNSILNN